ncbi:MAG: hypothetical protein ABUS54_10300 [Actinomycetota bacterium]
MPSLRPTLAAAVAAAALGSVATAPAAAAGSCGQAVLDAWAKGTLGPTFPAHCYQDALQTLPPDVAGYSSASDDIHAALAAALRLQDVDDHGPSGPSAAAVVAIGGGIALAVALLGPIGVRRAARALSSRRAAHRRSGA